MTEIVIIFVIVFLILGLAAIGAWINFYSTRKAYLESLELLKADPHSPALKESALNLGRRWLNAAASLRNMGFSNAPVVEEATLLNDINAATARAGSEVVVRQVPVATVVQAPIEERLLQLESLRQKTLSLSKSIKHGANIF